MSEIIDPNSMDPSIVTIFRREQDGAATEVSVVRVPLRDEFEIDLTQE